MRPDPLLDQIVADMRAGYGCHTVILYGSRARGEQRPGSDYDLLGVRPSGERIRDARLWNGVYLDLFIEPEAAISQPDETMLQCLGGLVLCQHGAIGDTFLAALDALFRAGPRPLPPDELEARRVWAGKMLARARQGDAEANYRRAWLLTALLEDYFQLRGQWYLGPKQSLRWLREHDPAAYAAFDLALHPGAGIEQIAALVNLVAPPS